MSHRFVKIYFINLPVHLTHWRGNEQYFILGLNALFEVDPLDLYYVQHQKQT